MGNTGFETDGQAGERIVELCLGQVIDRADPDGLCRVRVRIPGKVERSNWARPHGGGSPMRGKADVPPLNADVYVLFLNGDPRMPTYWPADYGVVKGKSEVFPEHTDPDVTVIGLGPFRLVIDNRTGDGAAQRTARAKLVKEINGVEEDIVWIEVTEDNSLQIHADNSIQLEAGAVIDVDAPVVQVKGRKIMNATRPI